MDLANQITELLIKDIKVRFLDESFPRIAQCLSSLSDAEIWKKPNSNSNSIGNLVLHLEGNIRQWLISGIGTQADKRIRDLEFSEKGPIPKKVLLDKLNQLGNDCKSVFDSITKEDLIIEKNIQGFETNVTSILIHITEHLSYHTGQIAFYTKLLKDIDLEFYGDLDLNTHNS
jgi:uncharacterized damage-inducible protein DinB